jgi:GNAT superfamily N-acetyltransferase
MSESSAGSEVEIAYSSHNAPVPQDLVNVAFALAVRVFGSIDAKDGSWRLERMPLANLFAGRSGGVLVGFKLGYAVTSERYYSWLGGVHPAFRGLGIARELMKLQHEWVAAQGFRVIETELVQDNHQMAMLNEDAGFRMAGMRFDGDRPRIVYRRFLGHEVDK